MAQQFKKIVDYFLNPASSCYSPSEFYALICKLKQDFKAGSQQDSHELLVLVLGGIF
jgi:hypothetical protein